MAIGYYFTAIKYQELASKHTEPDHGTGLLLGSEAATRNEQLVHANNTEMDRWDIL